MGRIGSVESMGAEGVNATACVSFGGEKCIRVTAIAEQATRPANSQREKLGKRGLSATGNFIYSFAFGSPGFAGLGRRPMGMCCHCSPTGGLVPRGMMAAQFWGRR